MATRHARCPEDIAVAGSPASSPKHRRTYRLINRTVELVDRLIHLASNPFMRPLRKQALRLLDELRDAAESLDDDPVEAS